MNRTFYIVAAVVLVLTIGILEALDAPSPQPNHSPTSNNVSDDNAGLKNLRIP